MSELTDLIIQIGDRIGWDFLLFLLAAYQLYCPRSLHPQGGTKLQRMLVSVPDPVAIVLELLAENVPNIDEDKVHDAFVDNGLEKEDFLESQIDQYQPGDD